MAMKKRSSKRGTYREEWLEHAGAWKDEYADNIHKQWAKMGLSLDYSKERLFTRI